jgi:hypothetical protein
MLQCLRAVPLVVVSVPGRPGCGQSPLPIYSLCPPVQFLLSLFVPAGLYGCVKCLSCALSKFNYSLPGVDGSSTCFDPCEMMLCTTKSMGILMFVPHDLGELSYSARPRHFGATYIISNHCTGGGRGNQPAYPELCETVGPPSSSACQSSMLITVTYMANVGAEPLHAMWYPSSCDVCGYATVLSLITDRDVETDVTLAFSDVYVQCSLGIQNPITQRVWLNKQWRRLKRHSVGRSKYSSATRR